MTNTGVSMFVFKWHRCRAQNDFLRAGICFLIDMVGDPNRMQWYLPSGPRTRLALFSDRGVRHFMTVNQFFLTRSD